MPIEIVATASEACIDADIIILATNHAGEVIDGDWVKPGAFVNAVGFHTVDSGELDTKTIAKADLVVCDEKANAMKESGNILAALVSGAIDQDQLINLGDIVTGARQGRTTAEQITIYRSLGNAFQDLAAAAFVYNQAAEKGMGVEFNF